MKKYEVANLIKIISHSLQSIYPQMDECTNVSWWVLQHVTGLKKSKIISDFEVELSVEQQSILEKIIYEHLHEKKPLQYILGTIPFGDLQLKVEPPILIPRSETEMWCYELIEQLSQLSDQNLTILDLCTGTGCVGLSIAKKIPSSAVYAVDINEHALALARDNARRNNVSNITYMQSDLFEKIPFFLRFDCIVSNPPYISEEEWINLDVSVKKWEDKRSLVAQDDGLALIKKIIDEAQGRLSKNSMFYMYDIPQLVIEIGYQQGKSVKKYMIEHGFADVCIVKDLSGKDRVVKGRVKHVQALTDK